MDGLFAKYEHELVTLRSLCREYAQRYPRVAARLQLGGEACGDPHVERLIQAVALLNARVSKRLDDAYPQFTEALLNLLFPHYLKPFPSCAIARFSGAHGGPASVVRRGTLLEAEEVQGVRCRFQTAYDVVASAIHLTDARFEPLICAPVGTRLPEGVTSVLTLAFESNAPHSVDAATKLRLFIDADQSFSAALRDVLFMQTAAAYLQLEGDDAWIRLRALPITPVGLESQEALIPFGARSHTAYRVLAEYFAFPEKFNFVDIDVRAMLAQVPPDHTRFTLRLAVSDVRPDADQARMLAGLCAQHLLPGCTPVVNLFNQPGVPIAYDQLAADYTVLADGKHPHAYEVYSVDQVHMVQQAGGASTVVGFRPFYSLRHGEDDGSAKGRYFILRHDEARALCSPGHEKSITLVDAANEPVPVGRTTLSIGLTCTNRDLPCGLKIGAPDGDLFLVGASDQNLIRFLRRPTRPLHLATGSGMHWRLISHLVLNHHSLLQEGPAALREMLSLYDLAQSPVSRRQIGGIVALEHRDSTAWIRH